MQREPRFEARWVGGVALGVVLGVLFLLAPVEIGLYVYSTTVFYSLWLIAVAGILVVPVEIERFLGERVKVGLLVTGALILAALSALLFAYSLPEYYYEVRWVLAFLQPLVWAAELLVAYWLAKYLIQRARAADKVAVFRWVGRTGVVILLLLMAVGERGARLHALRVLKPRALHVFARLHIYVPPRAAWRASYGAVSQGLSAFEHPPFPPTCGVSANYGGWVVTAGFGGYHPGSAVTVEGRLSPRAPATFREACDILRRCPPLRRMPICFHPRVITYGRESDLSWGLGYMDNRMKPVPGTENVPFDPLRSYCYVGKDGRLRLGFMLKPSSR